MGRSRHMSSFRRVDVIRILANQSETMLGCRVDTLTILCLALLVTITWCDGSAIAMRVVTRCVYSSALA